MFNPKSEGFKKLIKNISEPFQFISIGLAKLDIKERRQRCIQKTIVNNPILLDASCSGIQHISALTLDKKLAEFTNVISYSQNPEDLLPKDFYTFALNMVNKKLKTSKCEALHNIVLTRKIIKRSVMTIPYNVSLIGVGEQLLDHFTQTWVLRYCITTVPAYATSTNKSISLNTSKLAELNKTVYAVLTDEIPSLRNLTKYFHNIIKVLTKINLPITWITPAGLKIKYQTIQFKKIKALNRIINSAKEMRIKIPTEKNSSQKMFKAFMPNYIHSLDASNVHLLLYNLNQNFKIPVYAIHDCFASTPNNMELLKKKVKEAFIKIYFKEEGYLQKTHNKIIEQIKAAHEVVIIDNEEFIEITKENKTTELLKIPQLPEAFKNENLDEFIKGLLNSKYFIG